MKRLVAWIDNQFNLKCCRKSVGKTLKNLGFSWKKARKLLNKANSKKRAEYLENLQGLIDDALNNGHLLVFIDEAHIHLDSDEGYGWSIKGERFWVSSNSPGRTKVSFYGMYVYNYAKVKIFPYLKADQFNTIDVLKHLIPIHEKFDSNKASRIKFHPVIEATVDVFNFSKRFQINCLNSSNVAKLSQAKCLFNFFP
ncbi:winged helix-turn-helix domain-containing protein [Nostoc sp. 'Peltigera malacea cyanobiont' DB3992]|uniref:winged helix-turn-helix domain-containing protein n=1 Tax=Nostoc sp. 'Peltigera malacea cyanobiont' DB3992 TaxID=1206980 RepID=UPI0015D4E8D6|nr:winged helix-turn-helix domain-containing protein [Nostoc sp. 'Peltigera malacea cyanobiont' DB3992]